MLSLVRNTLLLNLKLGRIICTPFLFDTANKDNQWADIVENELKHILEPKKKTSIANSTPSDSSASPPLPPVSPDASSDDGAHTYKHKRYV